MKNLMSVFLARLLGCHTLQESKLHQLRLVEVDVKLVYGGSGTENGGRPKQVKEDSTNG
ncbi:hypothetical protein J8Z24_03950 [Pseudoalteromonas sp. SCSIO 43201]|uniref:Uncharacterized protein n=1 Tax=Pseudoalteromonas peptidolytica F12-50-A1 TaxID=1315280 RepID=A0A8I0MYK2_9GAMM|nr:MULTISPECIES: hypothetical protein [Pseudoalteromonas]MBE0347530.1 hypothetical protein [Pseudoalteromonas peptidolytica F12-50-A1]MDW7549620.1 hypothetical protein [Pseudoalteromonas peptidolytica]USD29259.1 hypothetical protein J8Z24_03950 [Pseudoalteromonas sp. SCSIO 43201]GEK11771.1 hypothetical protein PPE03_40200 [Pseudoalteromonas peptidolytica]